MLGFKASKGRLTIIRGKWRLDVVIIARELDLEVEPKDITELLQCYTKLQWTRSCLLL